MLSKIFSSPFISENILRLNADKGKVLRHFKNAEYSIAYHLEKVMPRGGVVWALFPKSILGQLLPEICKKKNCNLINVHGTKKAVLGLLKAELISKEIAKPDLILTEPDGLSPGGALFQPEEAKILEGLELVGIGSILQWTFGSPATHDYVRLSKIITEIGIHSPEELEKEINAFSWSNPSVPFQLL